MEAFQRTRTVLARHRLSHSQREEKRNCTSLARAIARWCARLETTRRTCGIFREFSGNFQGIFTEFLISRRDERARVRVLLHVRRGLQNPLEKSKFRVHAPLKRVTPAVFQRSLVSTRTPRTHAGIFTQARSELRYLRSTKGTGKFSSCKNANFSGQGFLFFHLRDLWGAATRLNDSSLLSQRTIRVFPMARVPDHQNTNVIELEPFAEIFTAPLCGRAPLRTCGVSKVPLSFETGRGFGTRKDLRSFDPKRKIVPLSNSRTRPRVLSSRTTRHVDPVYAGGSERGSVGATEHSSESLTEVSTT